MFPTPTSYPLKDSLTKPTHYRDNTYLVIDSLDRDLAKYSEPNDYVVKLPENVRNADAIELLSFQMTRTETNIHSGNNTYSVTVGATTYTGTLAVQDIDTGSNLAATLQASIRTATGNNGFLVTYTASTGAIRISNTVDYSLTIGESFGRLTGLYSTTGMRGAGTVPAVASAPNYLITGTRSIDLKGVPYLIVAMNDYGRILSPSTYLQSTFMTIPMESRTVGERFIISNDEKEKRGTYILANHEKNIHELRVKLMRPDGSLYTTNGLDHLFVFRILKNNSHDYNS